MSKLQRFKRRNWDRWDKLKQEVVQANPKARVGFSQEGRLVAKL